MFFDERQRSRRIKKLNSLREEILSCVDLMDYLGYDDIGDLIMNGPFNDIDDELLLFELDLKAEG